MTRESSGRAVRLWIGDGAMIASADSTYDSVFDFGVVHHVERWMDALREVELILRPGGRFYAEEPLRLVCRGKAEIDAALWSRARAGHSRGQFAALDPSLSIRIVSLVQGQRHQVEVRP